MPSSADCWSRPHDAASLSEELTAERRLIDVAERAGETGRWTSENRPPGTSIRSGSASPHRARTVRFRHSRFPISAQSCRSFLFDGWPSRPAAVETCLRPVPRPVDRSSLGELVAVTSSRRSSCAGRERRRTSCACRPSRDSVLRQGLARALLARACRPRPPGLRTLPVSAQPGTEPARHACRSFGASRAAGPIRDYTAPHGAGARPPARVRAAAQAAAAAHRLDRPGRRRGARGRAREALDQEGREGLGARARAPLLRPDDARGPGHARQGRRALLEGDPARPERPERPLGRCGLRLPEPRPDREGAPRRQRREGRERRDRVPVRPEPARREAARRRGRRRDGRRRDRHGDRPRRVPLRPLREGLRRDRAR